jgi:hypothetical protein
MQMNANPYPEMLARCEESYANFEAAVGDAVAEQNDYLRISRQLDYSVSVASEYGEHVDERILEDLRSMINEMRETHQRSFDACAARFNHAKRLPADVMFASMALYRATMGPDIPVLEEVREWRRVETMLSERIDRERALHPPPNSPRFIYFPIEDNDAVGSPIRSGIFEEVVPAAGPGAEANESVMTTTYWGSTNG